MSRLEMSETGAQCHKTPVMLFRRCFTWMGKAVLAEMALCKNFTLATEGGAQAPFCGKYL